MMCRQHNDRRLVVVVLKGEDTEFIPYPCSLHGSRDAPKLSGGFTPTAEIMSAHVCSVLLQALLKGTVSECAIRWSMHAYCRLLSAKCST